ncbi:MAG TPA: HEAT repeat domain-containing protein [Candidatus Binatia bacterium]|jgi:HEAT repeat protein|nr:HEAT repeat domain-containing protein [Candidatus Binatia bacterium]
MDNTLQEILTLVEKGTIEQRCAALLVLGALKSNSAAVVKLVGTILEHPNPVLKDYALRYFEEVQPKNNIVQLLKMLDDPDKEMQERAVRSLIAAQQSAVQPLLQAITGASRVWQLNAARVLCAVRGKAAMKGLLQMLAAGTDEANKVICDLLTPAVREMDAKEHDALYDEVESLATKLDVKQHRPAVVSAMRLLGQLGRPQARRWLCKFVGAEHHPAVRSHALVALLRCLREQDIRKEEYTKLFPLLEEAEFSEVTRLALDLLDAHELPNDSRSLLAKLMQSPHTDVQKFALRKMGDVGTPATVRTLVEQLGDPDYRRRDVAASSLRKIPEARAALIKELTACEDASKAWSIAELLPSFEGKWRQDTLETLWNRLREAIDAQGRIQTAFLHVLKQADAEMAYNRLAEQGAKLVKAKKYKEAIGFLTPLKEFSQFKPENKFHLAWAQLKLHAHTVASHKNHPAVELFTDLYRNSAYPVFEALKKEKSLAPEDLFALGFGLAERTGQERGLGIDLLEHVAEKFPRNKIGKSAKNKLKLAGV